MAKTLLRGAVLGARRPCPLASAALGSGLDTALGSVSHSQHSGFLSSCL